MTVTIPAVTPVEIRHFHVCCGGGSGAKGFNKGAARVGKMQARMRCIGGVDHDPLAIADFDRLAGAKGTVLDLFDYDQYVAFHGKEPPAGWRPATPDDIRRAAGGEFPHIVFTSMPCKGFSGLLSESKSRNGKYQALNGLTLRGVWLTLEAFADNPPELWIFENVPRIANRGRPLLDQIKALFRAHGYAVEETTHDCGEIGGLAESRKRFLLVARHMVKVPPFLYEPPKKRLKGVGEVLDKMPMPGDPAGGPMHRIPSLQWKTWVRLAFVEAGKDWRSLNRLAVEDGMLRDYGIAPDVNWQSGVLGVNAWEDNSGTVAGRSGPTNGAFSVADPRAHGMAEYHQYGVRKWGETSGAISGQSACGGGTYSVADPRPGFGSGTHHNIYHVVKFGNPAKVVTGGSHPAGGGQCVADPRPAGGWGTSKYRVTRYKEESGAVIAASTTGDGAYAVADPRCTTWSKDAHQTKLRVNPYDRHCGAIAGSSSAGHGVTSGAMSVADPRPAYLLDGRDHYQSAGMYGVLPYMETSGAVNANACHDNGWWSVADPRIPLPAPEDRLACVIIAEDETWHRPFTTLELAAIQTMLDPEEEFERIPVGTDRQATLDALQIAAAGGDFVWRRRRAEPWMLAGSSDSRHRECIGNAVPADAAEAIASSMAHTLLLAWSGHTFVLSATPIWVLPPIARIQRELAISLSIDSPSLAGL